MFKEFGNVIGNTPLIQLKYKHNNRIKEVYAKLEMFQFSGSIKDRVAYYMIVKAIEKGRLHEGMPIVEASSGNTGIALAAIGRSLGYDVVIFMPDWVSQERVLLMRSYGAEVRLVSRVEGGFQECIKRAREFALENNGYFTNQFSNLDNVLAHFESTGPEIYQKLDHIEAFVSGVGSGGTLMGVGGFLKNKNADIKVIALEPLQMPLLSGGNVFHLHQIEGIGDEFVPSVVDRSIIDDIVLIDDIDAIKMAQKIALELGLGVGISSGANLLASILVNEKCKGPVATVFADDNKKYLSTNLMKDVEKENSIVDDIQLLSFKLI